ncbi:MAG TPA: hypothetical protein VGH56_03140 [Solirubrobacteraceae bacterium]|jgi:hypothetical protein
MDAWTFVWLMVFLKIPIVALFLLVRWAVREPPATLQSDDGGIGVGGTGVNPLHPHHPRSPRGGRGPIIPRRGPHDDPTPAAPPRVRTVVARGRLIQR